MIDIPAGSFTMGSNFFSVSAPQHTVTFASGFQISKSEITADHYQLCVDAEYCSSSGTGADCNSVAGGKGDHPQNCITRAQLKTFATWVGSDLPSEAEWEYAARLNTGRTFPWGNSQNTICALKRAQYSDCQPATVPTCSYTAGVTPEGICDLSGNVAEWTLDRYQGNYTGAPVDGSPQCLGGDCDVGGPWVIKGGSYQSSLLNIILYLRQSSSEASSSIGGRIVRFPN
jgi:formylglycine-generating enzyme required for sulfatase activity